MNNSDMPNSMLENKVKANNKIPNNCRTLELFKAVKLCFKAQNTLHTDYSGSIYLKSYLQTEGPEPCKLFTVTQTFTVDLYSYFC